MPSGISRYKKAANAYTQAQINTASPGKRVVMLYDGIIKNVEMAMKTLKEKPVLEPEDIISVHDQLQLAEKIILELQLALDMENGGEISENLFNLYAFWMEKISEANVHKNAENLEAVIGMIREMRNTWDEAVRKLQQQESSS